jgi:hypothetical protein
MPGEAIFGGRGVGVEGFDLQEAQANFAHRGGQHGSIRILSCLTLHGSH